MTPVQIAMVKITCIIFGIIVSLMVLLFHLRKLRHSKRLQSIEYCIKYLKLFKECEFIKIGLIKHEKSECDFEIKYDILSNQDKVEFERLLCYLDDLGYMRHLKIVDDRDSCYLFGWYIWKFYDAIKLNKKFIEEPDWKFAIDYLRDITKLYKKKINKARSKITQ